MHTRTCFHSRSETSPSSEIKNLISDHNNWWSCPYTRIYIYIFKGDCIRRPELRSTWMDTTMHGGYICDPAQGCPWRPGYAHRADLLHMQVQGRPRGTYWLHGRATKYPNVQGELHTSSTCVMENTLPTAVESAAWWALHTVLLDAYEKIKDAPYNMLTRALRHM